MRYFAGSCSVRCTSNVTFDNATIEAELATIVPRGAWQGWTTLVQTEFPRLAVAANRQGGILRRSDARTPRDALKRKLWILIYHILITRHATLPKLALMNVKANEYRQIKTAAYIRYFDLCNHELPHSSVQTEEWIPREKEKWREKRQLVTWEMTLSTFRGGSFLWKRIMLEKFARVIPL